MAETAQDDTFYARNVRHFDFTVIDGDNATPNTPLDLTSYTVKWAMSRKFDDGTFSTSPLVEKTVGTGLTIVDAAQGEVRVTLDAADTEGFSGEYYHELEVFSGGEGVVVATGTLTILKNVVNT